MFKICQKAVITFVFLISCLNVFGQGTSNKGKDFWVAYQSVSDDLNSRLTLFITSNDNAVVNIVAGGQSLPTVNVIAGQTVPVLVDPNIYTNAYISGSDAIKPNAGIHVTSDVDIIVYCHLSFSARSASSLILPVKALGNEYYSISYVQKTSGGREAVSEFSIVGIENNTLVEIKPTANSLGNTKLADDIFQITLNKGDVYQYKSTTDLTGSKIVTVGGCKPLAVFSGSTFVAFCEPGNSKSAGSGDPLYQQLFPVSAWGQNFVTAPFYNAQNGSSDILRIQVAKNNTVVTVNGSTTNALGVVLNNPYSAGDLITIGAQVTTVIKADAPISVTQFQVTQACNPNNPSGNPTPAPIYPGDPEMTILNPIEQTLKDITVYSAISTYSAPTNITKHYLNIILKTADLPTLKVDGSAPTSNFQSIDGTYSYVTIDVTSSSSVNPAHRIQCENGFVAVAYGYGNVESYAYLAGADLKNLNAGIELFPAGEITQANSLCVGEDYNIKLKLPYRTSQIIWDFNNGAKTETISNPIPTPETVDGKISYYYDYQIAGTDLQLAGNYIFKATVINPAPTSCDPNEDVVSEFDVFNLPSAVFSFDKQQTCKGESVTFTDSSLGNGKNIEKWFWDFGDGSTVEKTTAVPFTHVYSEPGDYNVTLYVVTETGCVSSVTNAQVVHVAKSPIAKFSQQPFTCANQSIQFNDLSTPEEGGIIKWEWNFGDPSSSSNTSTDQNPTHSFSEVKTYDVTLKLTTDLGCETLITQQIKINPLPVASFETPDICLSDASATFTNTSTIADGSVMTYVWNFGDIKSTAANNTSTQKNPSHVYTEAAVYQVTLEVTSGNGCVTTLPKAFTVNGSIPKAMFTVQNDTKLCSDQEVVFEDRASVDFGEVTKIEWIYDVSATGSVDTTDNNPASSAERLVSTKLYKHTYPSFFTPATKDVIVRMRAYSGTLCVDSLSKLITLKAIPKVEFTLPDGCLPNGEAAFINQSTFVGSKTGLTYLWDFGDGTGASTSENPVYKFGASGTYQITLTVTAPNGCVNTAILPFTVTGAIPEPAFSVSNPNGLCSNQPVTFTDNVTIAFGTIKKIEWFFDMDNNPSNPDLVDDSPASRSGTAKTYQFTYPKFSSPATLSKKVRMIVTGSGDCVKETTDIIALKAVPTVVFDALKDVCAEVPPFKITQASETTGFSGSGIYTGAGITDGDGTFSPAKAGVGKHTITYTFNGDNGCSDFKTQNISVFATPTVDAGTDKIILTGGEVILNATATGKNLVYKWSPSNDLDRDDILNPVASPTKDIVYTLMVSSDEGCVLADEVAVQVLQFPEIPNTFTPNGDGVNDTWNIKYLDSYPNSTIKVFNRYGKEVFSSTKYLAWDGKVNNQYLPEGMYYYIITAKNGELKYSGSLLLVK